MTTFQQTNCPKCQARITVEVLGDDSLAANVQTLTETVGRALRSLERCRASFASLDQPEAEEWVAQKIQTIRAWLRVAKEHRNG